MTTFNLPAYQFVQSIAHHFDRKNYPQAQLRDIADPNDSNLCSPVYGMPADVQRCIYNKSPSISNWFLMTGFLHQINDPLRKEAINSSAGDRLEEFGKRVRFWQDPSAQLLHYIFEQAIERASPQEIEQIIQSLEPFRSRLDLFSFKCQRFIYRVEACVITALSNWYIQALLSAGCYMFVSKKIEPWVVSHWNRALLPRGVLWITRHAPLTCVRIIDLVIRIVQYILKNSFMITLGFYGSKWVFSRIHPAISRGFQILEKVIFLPKTVMGWFGHLSYNIASHTWTMQGIAAEKLKQIKIQGERIHSQDEILKAYQLWMDLMQNGPKNQIFTIPTPPSGG